MVTEAADSSSRDPEPSVGYENERRPSEYGPSIIGATLVMRGELTLDEDLTIDGRFEGAVINGVHKLSVSTFAEVKADIRGESADIAGVVDGDFDGDGTVYVHRTARLNGEITAYRLYVEDGTNLEHAILSGRISRADES